MSDKDKSTAAGGEEKAEAEDTSAVKKGKAACSHTDVRPEQESHYAPTGKGVIISRIVCNSCGHVCMENVEVYD